MIVYGKIFSVNINHVDFENDIFLVGHMSMAADITLIGAGDPDPIDVVNGDSASEIVLLCEHAGRAVPGRLGNLGVSEYVLASHRGWDICAEVLARKLADILAAPLVIQTYSRLVIDCNRPPRSPLAVPLASDGVPIPGNKAADKAECSARADEIFMPMDRAIEDLFASRTRKAAFSIHSFTPRMNAEIRPWHAGFISRRDLATANALIAHMVAARPDLNLAINEPYQIDAESDWFIPHHVEARNLRHCLIEIRNDQLGEDAGAAVWAELLANAIQHVIKDPAA